MQGRVQWATFYGDGWPTGPLPDLCRTVVTLIALVYAVLHHYRVHPDHRFELEQDVCMQRVHQISHQVIPMARVG